MKYMNVGPDDPCPCGSGRKAGDCCLARNKATSPNAGASEFLERLRQAMLGTDLSWADAEVVAQDFIDRRNSVPLDDFQGLSAEQMYHLLHRPLDSPHLVTFADSLETPPSAPIITLFDLLVEALGEQGIKPTAKGNLPRKFCREAALAFWGEDLYRENTEFRSINSEEDFDELHITRVVAEMTGLVRKYRGRLVLSGQCRTLLARGLPTLYPRLFKTYVVNFNWEYWDGNPDMDFIQDSFLFTLHLLHRYGDQWRPASFYEDCFLQAFPSMQEDVKDTPTLPAEKKIRLLYTRRVLLRFAWFMGLVAVDPPLAWTYLGEYRIKKQPLLDEVVCWHLPE